MKWVVTCWRQPISVRVQTRFDPRCSLCPTHGSVCEQIWMRGSTFHHCLSHPLTSFGCYYCSHKVVDYAEWVTNIGRVHEPGGHVSFFHTLFIAISQCCFWNERQRSPSRWQWCCTGLRKINVKEEREPAKPETSSECLRSVPVRCGISNNFSYMMVFWFDAAVTVL